MKNPS